MQRVFDTGVIKIEFRDADGDVFASLRVNPTDAGLLTRAGEVSEFLRSVDAGSLADAGTIELFNKTLEEKISYLLGYDAREELFSRVTATTISPDGELFARAVIDAVADAVSPELQRRAERLRERVASYTGKYEADAE